MLLAPAEPVDARDVELEAWLAPEEVEPVVELELDPLAPTSTVNANGGPKPHGSCDSW